MSFPEKIKLTSEGESITLHVQKCGLAAAGKYPEVEFTGTAGARLVVVPVPKASADRQLGRIPFSYQECVGATLTISRDRNDSDASKPYWGITIASGHQAAHPRPAMTSGSSGPPEDDTPHPSARSGATEAPAEQTPRDIYLSITKSPLKEIVPLYVEAKIPVSMEAVAAIVATRFITATQRR